MRHTFLKTISILLLLSGVAHGQLRAPSIPIDNPSQLPDLSRVLPAATDAQGVSATLQIVVLLTILTLIPSILIMTTAFPRIMIVLGLLRQAIGAPQLPPGQILVALSLFITILVMAPTWHKIQVDALNPYLNRQVGQTQALEVATSHLKEFMYAQIEHAGNEEDIYMFMEYAENREIAPTEKLELHSVSLWIITPAFMISELKTGFVMGFRIYLPFLVIDMVIATILLSMGMMMLPPVLISLPFKLLLFVLADGWHLVVENLLTSFQ